MLLLDAVCWTIQRKGRYYRRGGRRKRHGEQTANMISSPLRECLVEMLGDDGEVHDMLVGAASLYDAAEQALREWAAAAPCLF
jgi:hypothetical protein